jgi:WXXGXW repeat (2 copies)
MRIQMIRKMSAAFILALTISGCATAAPAVRAYVRIGPPAPIVEARTFAPGPGYVWIAGYHRWDGAAYVWVPGQWERPPRARARWAAGHWVHNGRRGWYFVDGRWR